MRFRIFAFCCLAFPFLCGWGHQGPKVKIGLSLDHAQGRELLVGLLKKEMEENRAELLVEAAKDDPAAQENQVRELIGQGIQALVVLPCNPSKAVALVEIAHQAGIKVVALEKPIPNCGLDYLIAFNPEKAGQLQAQSLVKKVSTDRYILLGKDPDNPASKEFREGQMKALQPLIDRGDIQIAASQWFTSPVTPSTVMNKVGKILESEGKKPLAILASDQELVERANQALEKAGLSRKVPVAGLGDDLATCRRIVSGTQALTVYFPPKKLAEETAYLSAKLARKATQFDCQFVELDNGAGKVQAVLLSPVAVDAKNLDSTILRDQVQRKEDVYGK